jgi:hypothetical protein
MEQRLLVNEPQPYGRTRELSWQFLITVVLSTTATTTASYFIGALEIPPTEPCLPHCLLISAPFETNN